MPSPDSATGASHDAAHWDARYASGDQLWRAGPHAAVVSAVSGMPRGSGRALDLGAGDGRHAVWLAAQGWQVTAVDFSAVGVELGRAHAREHELDVSWVVADVGTWEPEAAFDLVLLSYFRLDGPDWARLVRWLAPGGHLLVVAHGTPGSRGAGPRDGRYRHTPASLRAEVAGRVGFEVLRCTAEPRVHTVGEPADGSDIVLVARRTALR